MSVEQNTSPVLSAIGGVDLSSLIRGSAVGDVVDLEARIADAHELLQSQKAGM